MKSRGPRAVRFSAGVAGPFPSTFTFTEEATG